jgi:hypothetical protein
MNKEDIMRYYAWVGQEAEKINSDGCTVVSEMFRPCCLEHDLAYRHKKDPRVAYLYGWEKAPAITRGEADKRFRECMTVASPLKKFSPLAYIRWLGVRVGGWFGWNK